MTFGPCALARLDGKTIMIPGAVPGDVVEITTSSEKRDYALGAIVRIVQAALPRREAPCPYASSCGGCDWQHIQYDAQTRLKAQVIADEFRHLLGIELDPDGLVEPAPVEFGYRSRVRVKTGAGGTIGFRHPGSNSFVPVEACLVAAPPLAAAAKLAAALGRRCAEIEVVAAQRGEVLIASLASAPGSFERKVARQMTADGFIAGLVLRCGAVRESFGDVRTACEAEPGCVIEADADLFSQVNRAQNLKLVAAVMQLADLSADIRVLDLFCGTGNFSLPAARRSARVLGLDHDALAIESARNNARRLGLPHADFIAMRALDGLHFLRRSGFRPQVLMLDPPRAGARDLIEPIVKLGADKLIYISCNPSTLVRDLRQFMRSGYKIQTVRGFDFFPNTHHIEILASMVLT